MEWPVTLDEALSLPVVTEEIEGDDGELIERFGKLITDEPPGSEHWSYNAASVVGEPVGLESPSTHEDLEYWLRGLKLRLRSLVAQGLTEDFLVSALADKVEVLFKALGDVPTWTRGAERREQILEQAADPNSETMRHLIARRPRMTVEEARLKALEELDLLPEPDAESATRAWAELSAWRDQRERYLSKETVARWRMLHSLQQTPPRTDL